MLIVFVIKIILFPWLLFVVDDEILVQKSVYFSKQFDNILNSDFIIFIDFL